MYYKRRVFTVTQQKVLSLLSTAPDRSFYTREIIRLTGRGVATIKRELDRMTAVGSLTLKKIGNQHHYQSNPVCPIYQELISITEKILGNDEMAITDRYKISQSALSRLARRYHIQRLSMFGSAARGQMGEASDIDLLVEFEQGKAPSLGGMVRIKDDLSALFDGRKVDIVTPSILNNPYRRRAIEKELKELYTA